MTDVLTESILESAKKLNNLMADDLVKKVLEIELNSDSSKNHNLLMRLIRSLDQYVNKQRDIKYVGLVGHYSSGKSSTINSILELSGTNDERDTGLNPTDKAITLITHPKNSSLLILMSREGGAVPIRTSLVSNDLLLDVVISDTPGSGDPDVVNELIQDFLPICDTIFYFIAATNPLDQADLPLLSQKAEKLPFIPLSFVITRTDEFRIDRGRPVSDDNLNNSKKDVFIGKLISRIKHSLGKDDINLDNFIFVDNEASYNVESLRETILGSANSIDQDTLIKMHAHKVEYYKAGLNAIFNYFLKSIEAKIAQCTGFVKTASENISRFDKSVEINNEKLKLLWAKGDTIFKDNYNEERRAIDQLGVIYFTTQLSNDRQFVNERKILNQIIEQQSTGYVGKLIGDLNINFKQRLREIKHNILDNVEKSNLVRENIAHLFPARLDFDPQSHSLEVDFAKLNDPIDSLLGRAIAILNEVKNSIKHQLSQVRIISTKEQTINALLQQYELGRVSINDSFDQYFDRIQMYRSAVLTKNTKETIEKLRIGIQLDALDKEFTDDYMASMKNSAVDAVYESNEIEIGSFKKDIESVLSKVSDIRNELERIAVLKGDGPVKLVKENVNTSILMTEIAQNKEEVINGIYQERLLEILDAHKTNFKLYSSTVIAARKRRNKLLLLWFFIILFLSILVYLGYKFFRVGTPTTTLGEILVSVGSTILFETIVLVFIHFKTNLKRIVSRSEDEFVKKSRSEIIQSFGESFWDDLAKKVEERTETNNSYIKSRINEKVEPIVQNILILNQKVLNDLLIVFGRFKEQLGSYQANLAKFYTRFAIIFSHSDKNTDSINEITKQIKELSIKPSFELLEETASNLENVKKRINSLKSW